MNKDQVKGVAKHVEGEVQQEVGKLTGDTSTELRGHAKELEGRAQKELGDARETLHDKAEDLARREEVNRELKR